MDHSSGAHGKRGLHVGHADDDPHLFLSDGRRRIKHALAGEHKREMGRSLLFFLLSTNWLRSSLGGARKSSAVKVTTLQMYLQSVKCTWGMGRQGGALRWRNGCPERKLLFLPPS